jgi:hypothetical protein
MYFKGVNRGMAFTKAGFYMTGLVCIAGVLATGSGSNALFLALGLGLSALVVSGILSEKVMQHCSIHSVEPMQSEQGIPFSVVVRLKNSHAQWTCYGLEVLAHKGSPKYKLLPSIWKSDFSGSVLRVGPQTVVDLQARTEGQPRGHIKKLYLTQTTLFPFNLVRKFKVDAFDVDISVVPSLDLEFLKTLDQQNSRHLQNAHHPQEFHSHRQFNPSDTHRRVDWKKSTSMDSSLWTVKVFRDTSQEFGILLVPHWDELVAAISAGQFEKFLSRLYTATHFAKLSNRRTWLLVTRSKYVSMDRVVALLSEFPRYGGKPIDQYLNTIESDAAPTGLLAELHIQLEAHHWNVDSASGVVK